MEIVPGCSPRSSVWRPLCAEALLLSLVSLLLCMAGLAALLAFGPRWIAAGSMGGPPAAEARRLLIAAERRWPGAMTLSNGAANRDAIRETKSLLENSLALNPEAPAAHARLADLLEREGDVRASALERARSAVLLAGSAEPPTRGELAAFAMEMARRAGDAAPGPGSDRVQFDAALLAGDLPLALDCLKRLLSHLKENPAECQWLQARLAHAAGVPSDEARLVRECLKLDPGRREAALALAELAHANSAERRPTIDALRKALERRPVDAKLWQALGDLLFLESDLEGAASALENAMRNDPNAARAMERLSEILERTGNSARAARLRKAAAEINR